MLHTVCALIMIFCSNDVLETVGSLAPAKSECRCPLSRLGRMSGSVVVPMSSRESGESKDKEIGTRFLQRRVGE